MPLLTRDFDYHLPNERIAQQPLEPRDQSRLLLLDRADGSLRHARFTDLPDLLRPGDLLVGNDSRVIPARLAARKATGGALEILLLRPTEGDADRPPEDGAPSPATGRQWLCLIGGRVRAGTRFHLVAPAGVAAVDGAEGEVLTTYADGRRLVAFACDIGPLLDAWGSLPLPPYIHQRLERPERYQTVYADRAGSAAAPTAGLHFTPALLDRLAEAGIGWATVTLHVGLDTFKPVEVEDLTQHPIHREWVVLPQRTVNAIADCRQRGGRVIAVGTTTVRVLESAALAGAGSALSAYAGWTDLFLYPGASFLVVDALITNFHLPRSSLLMLVSAFAGKERIDEAYREAIQREYRFFSFGDAMLIL